MRAKGLISVSIVTSAALLIGVIAIFLTSKEPMASIRAFFLVPFSNSYFFGNMLTGSIPLMLTGLATSIAFTASAFNLGLEGQVYFGALCGTYVALRLPNIPPIIAIFLTLSVSFLSGGVIAAFSGYLKTRWKIDELISSLIISYALVDVVNFFIEGPFKDPSAGLEASLSFNNKYMLPKIFPPSGLHIGIFIALGIIVFFYFVMSRTSTGYEIRLSGKCWRFAEYSGISKSRATIVAMFLSGGLAGLAGMIDILGVHGRLIEGYSFGYGWNGIGVALLAQNNPLGVIPASIFFAFLSSGANTASLFSDVTPEIAHIIQASVFYLVTVKVTISILQKRKVMKDALK